jgi:hypothetical protein
MRFATVPNFHIHPSLPSFLHLHPGAAVPWGIATAVLLVLAAWMWVASHHLSSWSEPQPVYQAAAWISLWASVVTVIVGLCAIWHPLPIAIVVLIAAAFLSRRPPPRHLY